MRPATVPTLPTKAVIQGSVAPVPEQTVGGKLRTVEGFLGIAAVSAGVWVVLPWWNTFRSTPTYAPLAADSIPEVAWGLIFVVAGALRVWALLYGGIRAKVAGAICVAFVWTLLLIVAVRGNMASIDSALFGALAGYSMMSLYRISGRR